MKYTIGYCFVDKGVSSGFQLTSYSSDIEITVENLEQVEDNLKKALNVDKVIVLAYYKKGN